MNKVNAIFQRLNATRQTVPTCLDRVLAIPRQTLDPNGPEATAMGEKWSKFFGAKGAALRPVQGMAFEVIAQRKTLLGFIGVGAGKTGICLLAGEAAGAKRPLVLAPPALVKQMTEDLKWWSDHFTFTPPRLVSYGKLSVMSGANILEEYQPDLVISDEAHYLKRASSSRTKRFLRYFYDHPTAGFIGVSGSLTSSSLMEYHHLLSLSLRENTPLPLSRHELAQWAACIDAKGEPVKEDWSKVWGLVEWDNQGGFFDDPAFMTTTQKKERVRLAFQKRLLSCPGVVHTSTFSCGASLHLIPHTPTCQVIEDSLKKLKATWCRPDGEELSEASAMAATAKNISVGFYYRWLWPDGVVDFDWLEARAEWSRQVRGLLTYRSRQGLDSPALVEIYASEGNGSAALQRAWAQWAPLKHRPQPPKEAVWLTEEVVDYAFRWLEKQTAPAVLWYSSQAVGDLLEAKGVQVHGAGSPPPSAPKVAASIQAHGTGRNLQHYDTAFIIEPPSGGGVWEQLLGRHHRQGQRSDLVSFHFLFSTEAQVKAIETAMAQADYVEKSTGVRQRITAARLIKPNQKGK
jgi:hypothetical protein